MPLFLKLIVIHALFFWIVIILPLISDAEFLVEGQTLNSFQFLFSKYGLKNIPVGVLLPISGVLFLKKKKLSKTLYVLGIAGSAIIDLIINLDHKSPSHFIEGIIFAIFIFSYLYGRGTVKEYFSTNEEKQKK